MGKARRLGLDERANLGVDPAVLAALLAALEPLADNAPVPWITRDTQATAAEVRARLRRQLRELGVDPDTLP